MECSRAVILGVYCLVGTAVEGINPLCPRGMVHVEAEGQLSVVSMHG